MPLLVRSFIQSHIPFFISEFHSAQCNLGQAKFLNISFSIICSMRGVLSTLCLLPRFISSSYFSFYSLIFISFQVVEMVLASLTSCFPVSLVMRKPVSAMQMRTKKAQISLRHPRSLISVFVVRCLDSIMPIVAISKTSRLQLASVAEQAGLSLTWSQTPEDRFSRVEAEVVFDSPLVP